MPKPCRRLQRGRPLKRLRLPPKREPPARPGTSRKICFYQLWNTPAPKNLPRSRGAERTGLGTPATRAGVLEKLVRGGFLERKGRQLLPTKKGVQPDCGAAGQREVRQADCPVGSWLKVGGARRTSPLMRLWAALNRWYPIWLPSIAPSKRILPCSNRGRLSGNAPAAALMCWRARRIFTALTGSASFPCGKTTAFSLQAQGTDQTDGGGALKEWAYQDERSVQREKKAYSMMLWWCWRIPAKSM